MQIGGLIKLSLIDYPGKTAAVVFTQGCNFRCPYCHNKDLVIPACFGESIPQQEIISFLMKRQGLLGGGRDLRWRANPAKRSAGIYAEH
jgi:pyruvate formate lyase activating enzyme